MVKDHEPSGLIPWKTFPSSAITLTLLRQVPLCGRKTSASAADCLEDTSTPPRSTAKTTSLRSAPGVSRTGRWPPSSVRAWSMIIRCEAPDCRRRPSRRSRHGHRATCHGNRKYGCRVARMRASFTGTPLELSWKLSTVPDCSSSRVTRDSPSRFFVASFPATGRAGLRRSTSSSAGTVGGRDSTETVTEVRCRTSRYDPGDGELHERARASESRAFEDGNHMGPRA